MDCTKCGYEMSPFDAECPRCKRMGDKAVQPPPVSDPGAHRASEPAVHDHAIAAMPPLAAVAASDLMLLRIGALAGSAMMGSWAGRTFGSMLQVFLGGG